jgi:hypothetical protein
VVEWGDGLGVMGCGFLGYDGGMNRISGLLMISYGKGHFLVFFKDLRRHLSFFLKL